MEEKQKNCKKGGRDVRRFLSESVEEVIDLFLQDKQKEKVHQQLVGDVCYQSRLFDEEKRANDRALEEALYQSRLDEQKRQEELKNKIIRAKLQLQKQMKRVVLGNFYSNSAVCCSLTSLFENFERETESAIFDSPRDRRCQHNSPQENCMLFIEAIKVFEDGGEIFLRQIVTNVEDQILGVKEQCNQIKKIYKFDSELHKRDIMSEFRHHVLDDKFICIDIKDDGNCLWNSISVSLFGDTSYMPPLRLLTAYTLITYESIFRNYLLTQNEYTKDGYKHVELTFKELVRASVELNICGDELHVLALSLILRRPIYSYGSFEFLEDNYIHDYTGLKIAYESDAFPNHFKYLANPDDENNEPILLYYIGESHYSVVLPYGDEFKPLVPKCEILRPLIDRPKTSEQFTLQEELKDLENKFKALLRSCNSMEAQRDLYEKVLVSAGQRGFNSAQNGSNSTKTSRVNRQ